MFCVPKLTLAGLKLSAFTVVCAVPLRDTDCGLPAALSAITKLATRVPLAVGAKEMDTPQEAPETRLPGQLFEEIE